MTRREGQARQNASSVRQRRRIVFNELRKRTTWFIQLRWWVPPGIAAGVFAANVLGFDFQALPVLLVAVFIMAYNILFRLVHRRVERGGSEESVRRFTYCQVGFDYAAMFCLVHLTGGAASPFIFFFIFHIVFASILLPPRSAYGFAALSAVGMALVAAAEYNGIIPHHPILFRGESIDLASQPWHVFVELLFFAASVFIAAFFTTAVMRMLRWRIVALDRSSTAVAVLLDKLNALYLMIQAIGSKQRLEQVLQIVKTKLTRVMDVRALSVKLLSNDGALLRYAAAYGLPESLSLKNSVIVAKSPLNRRIIEGEPFVTGNVSQQEMFQFGEDLAAGGLRSVLFVPLKVDNKVIGILGVYCTEPDRFDAEDVDFFQQAADLVAIAIENARAYEEIEQLVQERSRFMMRVAHNLRAPLAATQSILGVVKDGYLGDLNVEQREYLRRIERRARTMLEMISELMALGKQRSLRQKPKDEEIDLGFVAGRLQRTFQDRAAEKGLRFTVELPDDPPRLRGNQDQIEQMLENLVSNAVKYTPEGNVEVVFSQIRPGRVAIEVRDTGIGIPEQDRARLFTDFFRADNAKAVEEIGTGLGLAIVKETVDACGGDIEVESREGAGTTFRVELPGKEEGEDHVPERDEEHDGAEDA